MSAVSWCQCCGICWRLRWVLLVFTVPWSKIKIKMESSILETKGALITQRPFAKFRSVHFVICEILIRGKDFPKFIRALYGDMPVRMELSWTNIGKKKNGWNFHEQILERKKETARIVGRVYWNTGFRKSRAKGKKGNWLKLFSERLECNYREVGHTDDGFREFEILV